MNDHQSTTRFSERAGNYELYRPGYPPAVVDWLEKTIGLKTSDVIADIGAGTGIFSALFLAAGYTVKGVEPNATMRAAAISRLKPYDGFDPVDGTAEKTSLADGSVSLITAAQAFHWFQPAAVKPEFKRILVSGGYTLLVWNILQQTTAFLAAYKQVKNTYSEQVAHTDHADPAIIQQFFYPNPVITHQVSHTVLRDEAGLRGLFLSSSKIPLPADSRYPGMLDALRQLYHDHAEQGFVKLIYTTRLYLAKI